MPISDPSAGGAAVSRRAAAKLIAALPAALVLGVPAAARASAAERAQALVTTISADLTRLVNAGLSEAQLYGEFEAILARYADMAAVAASTLGQPWRGASAAQQQAYVAAFQRYVARKYGRQFNEFRDAQIQVAGARDGGARGVLVQTAVVRAGEPPLAVDWQISERSGSAKAVNLVIEGVSLLANERAEVGAMLDAEGGSLEGLIAQMQARS